jgi:FlaA1/EpsC-like NDP-sugar epimerase
MVTPSAAKRLLIFLAADSFLIGASLYLSFLSYFEFNFDISYADLINETLFYFIILKISALAAFQVYKITWRYVGLSELVDIFLAILISELVLTILSLPNRLLPNIALTGLSKKIFFVDGILSFGLIGALRLSKRFYLEIIRKKCPAGKGKNTLIIGAGDTGEMILRDMICNNFKDFYPIGFLDDNKTKIGACIHGVKVLGATDQLAEGVPQRKVQAIIIAIPRLNHKNLRRLYEGAKKADIQTIKIVPRIYDFGRPDIGIKTLESISIEDLIGRQSICVDYQGIGDFIRGKSILVTGAGGSIGAEIVVQICAFAPEQVILFDVDETELHNLGLKLQRMFPPIMKRIAFVTGDIRDEVRIREVFDSWRPQIVFHAAAYKHVPMMEWNPKEAVKVNIFGTFNVARAAKKHNVDKFIMISTDKAVRPSSVMGATKRMAEYICSAFNKESNSSQAIVPSEKKIAQPVPYSSLTQFISVRFGNVLGSRGSVLPLFLEQLKHGGPLTVTGKEMKRYFMTIPEAVSLVLQASILGNGGEVFVLDMGDPIKIIHIAEELIRLHGMVPYRDIDIQFTEKRPGEKLFEEILTAEEGTDASRHEKIFIARNGVKYTIEQLNAILKDFSSIISDSSPGSDKRMKKILREYMNYYIAREMIAGRPDRKSPLDSGADDHVFKQHTKTA